MEYSDHATKRMKQRQITPAEVEEALRDMDATSRGDRSTRIIRWGTTGSGSRLRVVQYAGRNDFVITAARVGE
ncbi:MAG: DUF4258 domain-containing protein [Actinomycetota bacterium]